MSEVMPGRWLVEWESGKTEIGWVGMDRKHIFFSGERKVTLAGLPILSMVYAQ